MSEYDGFYNSLEEAKDACDKDEHCGKIHDAGCNGVLFKLCTKGGKEIVSKEGSCLYVHDCDTSGNYQSRCIFNTKFVNIIRNTLKWTKI